MIVYGKDKKEHIIQKIRDVLKQWDGPRTLHEMFSDIPEDLLAFIPDYKLNLLVPAEMSDEEIQKFRSGLREIFLFLKYSADKSAMAKLLQDHEIFTRYFRSIARVIPLTTAEGQLTVPLLTFSIDFSKRVLAESI